MQQSTVLGSLIAKQWCSLYLHKRKNFVLDKIRQFPPFSLSGNVDFFTSTPLGKLWTQISVSNPVSYFFKFLGSWKKFDLWLGKSFNTQIGCVTYLKMFVKQMNLLMSHVYLENMWILFRPCSPQAREGEEGAYCTFRCELYPPKTSFFPPLVLDNVYAVDTLWGLRLHFTIAWPTPKPFFENRIRNLSQLAVKKGVRRLSFTFLTCSHDVVVHYFGEQFFAMAMF